MTDWRNKTPLAGAERYLWKKLDKFPDYDWRVKESRESRSALHIYYEEGWELVHSIQDRLWGCSSSSGNSWPYGGHSDLRLFNVRCSRPGCTEWADSILNEVRTDRKDETGDYIFERLPDAPRFGCFAHHYEDAYGEKYIPPTAEDMKRNRALWNAMDRMHKENPPTSIALDGGLEIDAFTMMDGNYLSRLAELAEEEYQKDETQIQ